MNRYQEPFFSIEEKALQEMKIPLLLKAAIPGLFFFIFVFSI